MSLFYSSDNDSLFKLLGQSRDTIKQVVDSDSLGSDLLFDDIKA